MELLHGWAALRPVGNSPAVRFSVLFPAVGYLILLNHNVVNWLQMDPSFSLLQIGSTWRLPFVFYGLTALAGASLIYAFRCPSLLKRYGSDAEYVASEVEYHFSSNHQRLKKTAVEAMLPDGRNSPDPDIAHALSVLHPSGAVGFDKGQAQAVFSEVLAIEWKLLDRSRPKSLKACAWVFGAGFLLLAVPSAVTFIEVSLSILNLR